MDKQLAGLNVIDFATLAAASAAVASLADGNPACNTATCIVSGRTARRMLITTETASVRWRADGSAAVNAAGSSHLLAINDTISFTGANYSQLLRNIRFMATASTCVMSITYFD